MAKQKVNNIRLGLFVVVASVLFIVGVYLIGANKNLFGDNFTISTILTNAGGLQAGNNVRYAGINVGTVEEITIITDSSLRVDLKLVNRVKPFIRKNAVATVSVDGIVGSALVNIIPGSGQAPEIVEGDVLQAANLPGAGDLMTTLGNTNQNVGLFVRDLLEISSNIKNGHGTIARLLSDSLMADHISATLVNLQRTSQQMLRVIQKLDQSVDELQNSRGLINQAMHDTSIISNVKQLSANLNQTISSRLDTLMDHLSASSENMVEATTGFKSLLQDIEDGSGPISALLYDEQFTQSIKQTILNLESGTAKFDEDMEALKHNFLFRRYFRKQEKRQKKASVRPTP